MMVKPMTDLSDAERARDLIADALLDGDRVVSVGLIDTIDGGFSVGVTATTDIVLPDLPPDLARVPVLVRRTGGPITPHPGHEPHQRGLARLFHSSNRPHTADR